MDTEKIDELQSQIDELEERLRKEVSDHNESKEEMENLTKKVRVINDTHHWPKLHRFVYCYIWLHTFLFSLDQ